MEAGKNLRVMLYASDETYLLNEDPSVRCNAGSYLQVVHLRPFLKDFKRLSDTFQ